MSFLWNLCAFIILIGVLVTVHEYGHFIVARKCGVKVLRFSIGFGKPLLRFFDRQGTEFVIAAIPLGGYVKMLDARTDNVLASEHHLAFNFKPVSQRIAIVAAGPFFNFIFAIFAFWLMYIIGVSSVKPVIGEVQKHSIASQAGLKTEQLIVSVDGELTSNWQSVQLELSNLIGQTHATISVQDSITSKPIEKSIDLSAWTPQPEKESLVVSLGIKPFQPKPLLTIAHVAKQTPAASALETGDRLISANGFELHDWAMLNNLIKASPEQEVRFIVERNSQDVELIIHLGVRENAAGNKEGFLGVIPKAEPWPEQYKQLEQYDVLSALYQASIKTWRTTVLSFAMVGKLFSGDISLDALSGPVSIAQGAGTTASYGIVYFLNFMAFISINLGIINLLPLPVLDGGHLLYYLIEFVRGKPVPDHIQDIGFRIGAFLLFSVMGIAILNDLSRL